MVVQSSLNSCRFVCIQKQNCSQNCFESTTMESTMADHCRSSFLSYSLVTIVTSVMRVSLNLDSVPGWNTDKTIRYLCILQTKEKLANVLYRQYMEAIHQLHSSCISHNYAFIHIHSSCVILIIWVRLNSGTFQIKFKFHTLKHDTKALPKKTRFINNVILRTEQHLSLQLIFVSHRCSVLNDIHASIIIDITLQPSMIWFPWIRSHGLHNYDSSFDQNQCFWLSEVRNFTNAMIEYRNWYQD